MVHAGEILASKKVLFFILAFFSWLWFNILLMRFVILFFLILFVFKLSAFCVSSFFLYGGFLFILAWRCCSGYCLMYLNHSLFSFWQIWLYYFLCWFFAMHILGIPLHSFFVHLSRTNDSKLSFQGSTVGPSPRPISTILHWTGDGLSSSLWVGSESLISKTSRTAWMILLVPSSSRRIPFRRWISKSVGCDSGDELAGTGSVDSHRTDCSQESTCGTLSAGMGGVTTAIVEIACSNESIHQHEKNNKIR